MRKTRLLTATALCLSLGLSLGAMATTASAATTISSATTSPVKTSDTGDLTMPSAGSITLTSGTAITVDSDNALNFAGAISMSASDDNSTGILISNVPNRTQTLIIGGTITVTDNYTASDTGSLVDGVQSTTTDGIIDLPWAQGTGRYGVHSVGASPFVGDVAINSTLDVEGNNSYAIRFENNINGKFTYDGTTTLIGDNSKGVSLENGVTGNIFLSGSINGYGQNTSAINLSGDLGGNVIIDGSYMTTGYAVTTSLTQAGYAALLPGDLLTAGPTVQIGSNVANGVLIEATPTTDSSSTSTDQDGDGITDSSETTATITSYGSSPALLIGSSASDITLGGLTYTSDAVTKPAYNYGLLIRGNVYGYGIHPGFDSHAVVIGGMGHTSTISNGIGVNGTVTASAYGSNSYGMTLASGAVTPRLDVNGSLTASVSAYVTSTTSGSTTTYSSQSGTATALKIDSGASLPILTVGANHAITASASGSANNTTAILDSSGTLTSITNNGGINASITATDANADGVTDPITGTATAIDVSANTSGVSIAQVDTAPSDDTIAAPYIYGKILFGSGNDSLTSDGGSIIGSVNWGSGTGVFTLTNKAAYLGQMTSTGDIAIDINSGSSGAFLSGSSVKFSTLHVGSDATMSIGLSADAPTVAPFVGSGAAVFDNGATLNLSIDKIITTPTTYKLLTASSITLGDLSTTSLDGHIPYLYHADLALNSSGTELDANFRLKTQAEGQFSTNQYNALAPILTAAAQDTGAATSLITQTTKAGFDQVYNQYFPDYSGESMLTLVQGAQALTQSLGDLTLVPDNTGGQWWFQEHGFHVQRDYGETSGFKANGFSFAGGRERQVYGNQMLGMYLSYTSSTPLPTFAIAYTNMSASDLTLGGYWRINSGNFKGWAHAGVGYTQFDTTRELITPYVAHIAKAKWNGTSTSAGVGASYQIDAGGLGFRPEVSADFYNLSEAKHNETGGGDYFDLNIADRSGHMLTSRAVLNVSYNRSFVRPEIWAGWKQNISADLPDTVANFTGGDPFTLSAGNLKGGGPVAGFRVSVDNRYSYFGLEGEYEKQDAYSDYTMALRARFQF
jgi:hypothetical protein